MSIKRHSYVPIRPPSPRRTVVIAAAMTAAVSPGVAVAGGFDLRYDAYVAGSPFTKYEFFGSDAHGPDGGGIELGFGGSISHRFGRFFDLGLGLRYDFGPSGSELGGNHGDDMHLVAVPLTVAGVIPIGTESELRIGVGLGPAFAWFFDGYDEGDSYLYAFGASTEVALAFVQRIRPSGLGVSLQVGIRLDMLPERNADTTYLNDTLLVNAQFPFVRVGATWR